MRENIATKTAITEQVLSRMAAKKRTMKLKNGEVDKPVMTPFQEALHERLQNAKSKVDTMLETTEEF